MIKVVLQANYRFYLWITRIRYLCKAVLFTYFWFFFFIKNRKSNHMLEMPPPEIQRRKEKMYHRKPVPSQLDKSLYLWIAMNFTLQSKVLYFPQKIFNQHWSETQIKGHHPNESKLIFTVEGRLSCTTPLNQHSVIITYFFPKIWHPLWPRKAETIILKVIHQSPPMWPYLPTNYQPPFNFLC